MNHENPRWGRRDLDPGMERRLSLKSLIHVQLPETRIFVDRLCRESTASGRRMLASRLVRNKGDLPWLMADHDDSA